MMDLGLFMIGLTYATAVMAGVVIAEVAMYYRLKRTLLKDDE